MLLCPDGFQDTEEEKYTSAYQRNICEREDKAKRKAIKHAMSVIKY